MDLILTFKRNWIPLFLFLCLNQTLQAKIEADFFSPELGKSYQLPDGLFQVIHLDNEKTGNGLLTLKTLGEIYLVSFENLLLDKNDRIVQGRIISAAPNHLFNPLTPEDLTRWKLKLTMEGELPTLLNHWVGTKDVDLNGNHLFLSSFELTVDGLFTNLLFINETPEDQLLIFEKQNVPFGFHGPDWCSLVMDLQSPTITNDPAFPITILKDSSYVSFNCNGFVEFSLTCQHTLNATHFLPVPPNGIGPIALFKVVAKSFNNFIGTVRVDPFRIKGISGVSFSVIDATVDYSSENNPSFSNILDCNGITVTKDPTWRGFFLKKLILTLDDLDSFSVSGENILVDGNGFSGQIVVNPNYNKMDKGWAFVLSSLSLKFNNFIPCGTLDILGYFKTPVSPDSMTYSVTLSKEGLNFIVKAEGEYRIPFLGENSKMILGSGSRAGLTINKDGFKPSFSFNGEFKISTGNFEFPALGFEGFQMDGRNSSLGGFDNINFTAFSFGGIRFNPGKTPEPPSGSSTTSPTTPPKVANYPFTLDNLEFKNNNSRIGLEFEVKLNLAEEAFLATTIATIWSNINLNDFNLGFPSLEVNAVQIKADLGAVNIEGGVCFYDNGVNKGFMGKLNMGIPSLSLKISSEAIFGNIINEYRYFYVAAGFENYSSTLGAPLAIYGFNGGFYYNMVNESSGKSKISQKDTFDSCNVGIDGNYKPREGAWGLTAGLIMGMIGVPQTLAADVTLTIAKTSAAGSFLVALAGDAYIMNAGIENRKNAMMSMCLKLVLTNGNLAGSLGGDLNIVEILKGGYNKDCSETNINFGANGNYFFLGKPALSKGSRLALDLIGVASVNSYFMFGTFSGDDFQLPDIPTIFTGWNIEGIDKLVRENQTTGQTCTGLGFGILLQVNGKFEFLVLRAHLKTLLGFDLQFKNCVSNTGCTPGNWSVGGGGYAGFGGGVDLFIDFLGIKGDFKIFDVNVAAAIQAEIPNPTYFAGIFGGNYNILGGLIQGKFSFHFKIEETPKEGKSCPKVFSDPNIDVAKIPLIDAIIPGKNENLEVYQNPAVSFKVPIGEEIGFTVRDFDGNGDTTWTSIQLTPNITLFEVRDKNNNVITNSYSLSPNKKLTTSVKNNWFNPNSNYNLRLTITWNCGSGCHRVDNNFTLDTVITFKSGPEPSKLVYEMFKDASPGKNQKYWYRNYAPSMFELKESGSQILFPIDTIIQISQDNLKKVLIDNKIINGDNKLKYEYFVKIYNLKNKNIVHEIPIDQFPIKGVTKNIISFEKVDFNGFNYIKLTNKEQGEKIISFPKLNDVKFFPYEKNRIYKLEIIRRIKVNNKEILINMLSDVSSNLKDVKTFFNDSTNSLVITNVNEISYKNINKDIIEILTKDKILYENHYFATSNEENLDSKLTKIFNYNNGNFSSIKRTNPVASWKFKDIEPRYNAVTKFSDPVFMLGQSEGLDYYDLTKFYQNLEYSDNIKDWRRVHIIKIASKYNNFNLFRPIKKVRTQKWSVGLPIEDITTTKYVDYYNFVFDVAGNRNGNDLNPGNWDAFFNQILNTKRFNFDERWQISTDYNRLYIPKIEEFSNYEKYIGFLTQGKKLYLVDYLPRYLRNILDYHKFQGRIAEKILNFVSIDHKYPYWTDYQMFTTKYALSGNSQINNTIKEYSNWLARLNIHDYWEFLNNEGQGNSYSLTIKWTKQAGNEQFVTSKHKGQGSQYNIVLNNYWSPYKSSYPTVQTIDKDPTKNWIKFYDIVTLNHVNSEGDWRLNFQEGNHQVTTRGGNWGNGDRWIIVPAKSGQTGYVQVYTKFRLQHEKTGVFLRAHGYDAKLSRNQKEVVGYWEGNGAEDQFYAFGRWQEPTDANNIKNAGSSAEALIRDQRYYIMGHHGTLHSHNVSWNGWNKSGQKEVTTWPKNNKLDHNDIWIIKKIE